ncbi:helix-turn-helix transcriptional regulator (plasmid) [Streptomyces yangpuensis]|uniref:Helix-turn-helix transcriptional regulator n=1 Tax=Streptomyces yangpuensis TaxID=1648182 RepID=A0ABY5QA45_9ACTN|nr:helix-turn-helix transcriptional regulator [Streptomyces yangpuensis]UUY52255.1 helix-turn-helix transcriptional regulator [Streptomyces yangpuensis]UUY52520.1 helix-turn-helix transcriptional regulator [Streptomyces yangpuensis]
MQATQTVTSEAAELVNELRRLRAANGNPSLRMISEFAQGRISAATLSRLFSGRILPHEETATAAADALLRIGRVPPPERARATKHVAELYGKARRAQRARSHRRVPRPREAGQPGSSLEDLQHELWELIRSHGLTLREISHHLSWSRSALSEALNHPTRPPSLAMVQGIARLCEVSPEPLLQALRRADQDRARAEEASAASTAAARQEPAPTTPPPGAMPDPGPAPPPSAAPSSTRVPPARGPGTGAWLAQASLMDILVQAAATRPPAEIAALVTGLKAGGEPGLAARIVQEAAGTRSADDVTALALALLAQAPNPTPTPAQPGTPLGNPFPGSTTAHAPRNPGRRGWLLDEDD